MLDYYDDPSFSYPKYWAGRQYEHLCEVLALYRLLGRLKLTGIADIGGGYGRLDPTLAKFARSVTLIEPSQKMRLLAAKFLNSSSPARISVSPGTVASTGLPASSQDAVVVVRVLHHLPDIRPPLTEIARILRPGGYLVLEFANSAHFKARLARRSIPAIPQDLRSPRHQNPKSIPFVNHRPDIVISALKQYHLQPVRLLSVSNFRHPLVKKLIPVKLLLFLEWIFQPLLARFFFGPSIFILARKADTGELSTSGLDKPQNP